VKLLIDNHCDVNVSNGGGNTALILSAFNGHLQCVKQLIDNHCDVNIRNNFWNISLILAAENGPFRVRETTYW
jgi:ankyrin repeat protein